MSSNREITFRSAVPADIPVIQDLSASIWREHYPGIITHAQIDYMLENMYAAPVMQDEMRKGYRYILVEQDGAPIGYISYRSEESEHAVMISKLYLFPALHGKGMGRQMLQYVKDDALRMGARLIYLFVNKNNRAAIRAYERFGFSKAEAVKTDIGGGFVMDDFRMELQLG